MISRLRRLALTLVLALALSTSLPLPVGAQTPPYLTQWSAGGQGLTVDAAGNVYVAGYDRILKFTSSGTYITQWGSAGSGDGEFNYAWAVATDAAGDVYVADSQNNRIQKFTSTGTYLTQWGGFFWPRGVATDAAGNVYVSHFFGSVLKFTGAGSYITEWGTYGSGPGEFALPHSIATDAAGFVYVSEAEGPNQRVQKFTGTGTYVTHWGSPGSGDSQFWDPYGIGTDAAGNVYVADTRNHRIQMFSGTGAYLTQWGSGGSGNGEFVYPVGVATDAAGNIYVMDQGNARVQKFGPATPLIELAFDFTPNTLNLQSHGLWVTGFLEPASPYAAADIDVASIRLNGTVPVDPEAPTALGDHNGNGVSDLMVKFNRAAVDLAVADGDDVPVTVTGKVAGHPFSGTDHIRIRRAVVSSPAAGTQLSAGSLTQLRWQTPQGLNIQSVAFLQTFDGGHTWSLIGKGLPNTGVYKWTVPNVQTDQAKVAVVLVESADATGDLVDGVLGVSGVFSIQATVGVGDLGPSALAIRGAIGGHGLSVEFSLRDGSPARLELVDVTGRTLCSTEVRAPGPGAHSLDLSEGRELRSGIYFLRLSQGGAEARTRVAFVK